MKQSLIYIVASIILVTGCSSNSDFSNRNNTNTTTEERYDLSYLITNSSKIEKEIENSNYSNVTLADTFTVVIPNTENVATFDLIKKDKMETEDIKKYLNTIIPVVFDESINLNTELRFISDSIPRNDSLPYPKSLPLLSDYLNKTISDINTYVLGDKNYYIELQPYGTINSLNDGTAQKFDKIEKECAGLYFATDDHIIEKIYNNVDCNDEYKLLDENISVSSCAKNTEEFISNYLSFNSNTELKPAICAAKAIEMDDDTYGLSFSITCSYKGILFDTYKTENDSSFTEKSLSTKERKKYNLMPGYAFVFTSNKINNFNDYIRNYDIVSLKEYNQILTPVKAMDICATSLSSSISFEISSCELKYLSRYTNDEATSLNVYPVWRFQSINTNDNLNYVMYVNAVNGDFDYYTY